MKKLLTAISVSGVIAFCSFAVAHAEPVKVGVANEVFPPFYSPDATGKWGGWEIEIMQAACAAAKLDCSIVPIAWDGAIPALNSRKIDMILASMSITEERLKVIDFSTKYYEAPPALIGRKDEKYDATQEGLKDKVVGVQVSTTHAVYAKKHFTAGTEIKEYQTFDEHNQELVSGRVDAVLGDKLAFLGFMKTPEAMACCEEKPGLEPDEAVYGHGVGFGLRKGDTELKTAIDSGILEIRKNGKYAEITKKYFDFDIYGDEVKQ